MQIMLKIYIIFIRLQSKNLLFLFNKNPFSLFFSQISLPQFKSHSINKNAHIFPSKSMHSKLIVVLTCMHDCVTCFQKTVKIFSTPKNILCVQNFSVVVLNMHGKHNKFWCIIIAHTWKCKVFMQFHACTRRAQPLNSNNHNATAVMLSDLCPKNAQ